MTGDARATSGPPASKLSGARESPGFVETYSASITIALFAAAVLIYFGRQPLWHTDLWGHLAYGRWIAAHGALPATEPFLPWDAERPLVDTAWLSQWLGYLTFRTFGADGVQLLYAGSIALAAAILAHAISRKTGSALWGIVGAAIFLGITWEQLRIVRPQLAGLICYVLLLAGILLPRRRGERFWIAILFVAWANMHGSFVIGLFTLAAACAGRYSDLCRNRKLRGPLRADPRMRRYASLLGIALAATFLNPYGPLLHFEVIRISLHPNLRDLIEWKPLMDHQRQLTSFVTLVILLAGMFALTFAETFSRRRITGTETFLVALLGFATIRTSRMILWWGPAVGWSIPILASTRWKWQYCAFADHSLRRKLGWKPTAIGVGILVVACLATPAGRALATGRPQAIELVVSHQTPVSAAEYLREHPPQGLIFNPMEWGDYLIWAGPENLEVFANSHVHLVPPEVWRDYMSVADGTGDVPALFARYNVEVIVADPSRQGSLIETLRATNDWRTVFEDGRSIIFLKQDTAQK